LIDLGFHGVVYTWSNKQAVDSHIREKLDKPDGTPEWVSLFKDAFIHHVPAMGSDHCRILVKLV